MDTRVNSGDPPIKCGCNCADSAKLYRPRKVDVSRFQRWNAEPDCLRAKVRRIIIGWIIFLATLRCSLLTMTIDADEENRKDFAIEGLLQRQKYNAAFNVATGWVTMSLCRSGSFLCFSPRVMPSIMSSSCHYHDAVIPGLRKWAV